MYVAVHVTDAPGASDAAPAGHDTAERLPVPENVPSTADTFASVTLPVFVTRNEYVTTAPAPATVDGVADFTIVNVGVADAVTVALEGGDVTAAPVGGVPVAVAVFVTEPASRSACVTV